MLTYKAQLSYDMVTVHYWVYTDRTQNRKVRFENYSISIGKDVENFKIKDKVNTEKHLNC